MDVRDRAATVGTATCECRPVTYALVRQVTSEGTLCLLCRG